MTEWLREQLLSSRCTSKRRARLVQYPGYNGEVLNCTMLESIARTWGSLLASRLYHQPIFQVGASRSGTIVLYKALGTHPEILSMPSEDPFVTYVAACVEPFEFGAETDYFSESVKVSKPYLYRELRTLLYHSAAGPAMGWKMSTREMLKAPHKFFSKTHWCVKCFPLERYADALRRLYPASKFIYIARSGIDVVQSRTKFPAFREQSFEAHCEFWVQAAKKFEYLTSYPHTVCVRQEQLLSEPEAMFNRIYEVLNLKHDDAPANYARTTLVHSQGDKATHTGIDVKKSLTERTPGHEHWDENQRAIFRDICGNTMTALGYSMPF